MVIMQYLENQEWYQNLVDDCNTILVERGFRARMEIIEGYHDLGKRIETDINFKKWAKGRGEAIKQLAYDIKLSYASLYYAIQFYKKWPDVLNAFKTFKEGKNISWFMIVKKYLPVLKPEKPGIPLPTRPKIYHCDYKDFLYKIENNSQDLLITDPPYSTDIENIEEFANDWVIKALDKVKPTGRAFICIGAYPRELKAYLDILLSQDKFILDNPLIWTYRNTLGQTPKMKYNLNYQIILHLYSKQSRKLDTKITNEMFSVQDINAPDGRQGNRYHTWQKPSELARRLITHTTQEGDEIFDCFGGTGTFVLVGAQLGRKVMGCDNSRNMLKIAEERGCEII
jgi:DNA modification methylase